MVVYCFESTRILFFNSPMRLIGKLFHSFSIEIQVDVFDVGYFREELSLSAIII